MLNILAFFLLLHVEDPLWLAAPLIKWDHDPPIELSPENRLNYKESPSLIREEERRNVNKLRERSFPWLGLIALAAATLLLMLPKRREPEAKMLIPLKETAMERLQALLQKEQSAEELYTHLTSLVREYLEKAYALKVTTKTTEEFFKEIMDSPIFNFETRYALMDFLQIADQVKFGRYQPTPEERAEAIEAAKKIVSTYAKNVN